MCTELAERGGRVRAGTRSRSSRQTKRGCSKTSRSCCAGRFRRHRYRASSLRRRLYGLRTWDVQTAADDRNKVVENSSQRPATAARHLDIGKRALDRTSRREVGHAVLRIPEQVANLAAAAAGNDRSDGVGRTSTAAPGEAGAKCLVLARCFDFSRFDLLQ